MTTSPYLSGDPVSWINEDSDISLRCYLELQEKNSLTPANYQKLEEYFARDLQRISSSLRYPEKNNDSFYTGLIWKFAVMVLFGLNIKTEQIAQTAKFIISSYRLPDGAFSYSWKPGTGDAVRTGDMVHLLIKSGISSRDLQSSLDWIRSHQRHDGGWLFTPNYSLYDGIASALFHAPGKGLRHEMNEGHASCPYSTISCLRALALAQLDDQTQVTRGAEMLAAHELFLGTTSQPVPLRRGWNLRPHDPGFPVLAQYDILDLIEYSILGGMKTSDPVIKAFNSLISRQEKRGSWKYENYSAGMLSRKPDDRLDRLVTIRMIKLIARMTAS